MKNKQGAILFAVIILIILLLYPFIKNFTLPCFGTCNDLGSDTTQNETYSDTSYIEIRKEVRVPVDSLVLVYDTTEIPASFDTIEALRDYFTRKYITYTFDNDTVKLQLQDSLYQNNVVFRQLSLDFDIPIIKDSTYVEVEKKVLPYNLYGGMQIGVNKEVTLTPTLLYNTGKNQFSLGYNLNTEQVLLGAYIGLK